MDEASGFKCKELKISRIFCYRQIAETIKQYIFFNAFSGSYPCRSKRQRHMTITSHPLANSWSLFNVPKSRLYFKHMNENCGDKLEMIVYLLKEKERDEQKKVINKQQQIDMGCNRRCPTSRIYIQELKYLCELIQLIKNPFKQPCLEIVEPINLSLDAQS